MEMLAAALVTQPLDDGQRVLALTFMHGARRRLADRLRTVPGLSGLVECTTIDGFASRITRRWRGLAAALAVPQAAEEDFDEVCDAAGTLLEQPVVANWVGASFPIILVDEGQDLRPQRLRMLAALSNVTELLVAADEFQCLDQALRPNPLVGWLDEICDVEELVEVHRTDRAGLLDAANSIRSGAPPANGQGFRLLTGTGIPLAATMLANAIAWRQGGEVAVITPSLQGGYARNVINRVGEGPCGQQGNGPYSIFWEGSDRNQTADIVANLTLADIADASATLAALRAMPSSGPTRATISWVRRQIDAVGQHQFSRAEIESVIGRAVSYQRQYGHSGSHSFTAMTVQQAKNREFAGVVVLWPYQVAGDAEHKRRLLYNAVTRARRWCTVIVQSPNILTAPPFA